jgi:hypothetical protein
MSHFNTPPPFGSNGNFTNNPSYVIGSTLEIKWYATRPEYAITLWHQSVTEEAAYGGSDEAVVYSKARITPEAGAFNWTVSPLVFDLNKSHVFFFAANNKTNSIGGAFLSHYFNLTMKATEDPEDGPSSLTVTSTSTHSATAAGTNSAGAVSAIASAEVEASNATAPLGRTAKIALGVGLGLAIPLLVVFFAIMFYLRRQRRQRTNRRKHADVKRTDERWKELSSSGERLELDGTGHARWAEIDGSKVPAQSKEPQGFHFGEAFELPSKRFSGQNQ